MKQLSVRISDGLHAKLDRAARRRGESKAAVVRRALERWINEQPASARELSLPELAGDLIGCLEGPGDLSTNPKYMEGFGE